MVAYSFHKRFVAPILIGAKAQTIRAERRGRSRHARPGEAVQLYTGMRTRQCRRLGEPVCLSVERVELGFSRNGPAELFEVGGRELSSDEMDAFAHADGFADLADMARFWWTEHPPAAGDVLTFEGVLIRWQPLSCADPLALGTAA